MQDGCRIFGNGKSSKTTKKNQHHKFPSGLGYPKPEGKEEGESYTPFRTLPAYVLGTVSARTRFLRTAISIGKTKASVSKLSFDTDANYFVLFSKAESNTSNFCYEENQGLIIERTLTNLRVDVSRPTLLEANCDRLTFNATSTGGNNSTVVNRVTETLRFGEGFICTNVHPMLFVGTALPLVGAVRITRYNTGREREGILIIDRS